MKVNTHKHS